ncbi:MAG: UDP-N-acetylmuramoyl-L-alanine--D-glutamate ligase [Erysipelotrichales bacterium]|nr:UDP-N-acetylmuramoyl-L-alanine--D-glutamate ligase [Erysipelotrichales bacterium]
MYNVLPNVTENTKIMLLGFSREGQSSYRYIRKLYPDLTIYIHDIREIDTSTLTNVVTICGEKYLEHLEQYDMILKSPGIVLTPQQVASCRGLTSQTELFIQAFGNRVIGITGTKGKSTTSSLTYHVLNKIDPNTFLVGNIGIPCFDCIEQLNEESLVVFELSCHQLEFIHCSPHVGIILNFFEEHLDHYGTYENYKNAKKHIYEYQTKEDHLLCNENILVEISPLSHVTTVGESTTADVCVNTRTITVPSTHTTFTVEEQDTHLLGLHNIYNIAMVYAIVSLYHTVSAEDFLRYISDFEPLAHRLKYIGTYSDIYFYDDSISTACETTISALQSIPNVDTVLVGGMDRGIDYTELEDYLLHVYTHNVILMPDSGYRVYEELLSKVDESALQRFHKVKDLEEAVSLSKKITAKDHACVLSPAAASYGFFKDFAHRGDCFIGFVKNTE